MESSAYIFWIQFLLVSVPLLAGVHSQWLGHYLNKTTKARTRSDIYDFKAPLELRQDFPSHFLGFDNEGRIVTYLEVGKWKLSELNRKYKNSIPEVLKYLEQYQQMVADLSLDSEIFENGTAAGPRGSSGIADFTGFKFNLINPENNRIFADIMSLFLRAEDYTSYAFLINLSSQQLWLLNVVIKPIIPGFFQRVQVFGTEPAKYIPAILKRIPRDQLPPHLGGYSNFTYLAPLGIAFNHNLT